jgi:hypothetical protein
MLCWLFRRSHCTANLRESKRVNTQDDVSLFSPSLPLSCLCSLLLLVCRVVCRVSLNASLFFFCFPLSLHSLIISYPILNSLTHCLSASPRTRIVVFSHPPLSPSPLSPTHHSLSLSPQSGSSEWSCCVTDGWITPNQKHDRKKEYLVLCLTVVLLMPLFSSLPSSLQTPPSNHNKMKKQTKRKQNCTRYYYYIHYLLFIHIFIHTYIASCVCFLSLSVSSSSCCRGSCSQHASHACHHNASNTTSYIHSYQHFSSYSYLIYFLFVVLD